MKFFHISDLHIGLRLMNRDLREDQEHILHQIVEAAIREQPDAVVIAGDIYDKAVPSAEAVEVFDRFTGELAEALPELTVMMISGNHDSAPRVNCFRSVLSRQHIHMIGNPPVRPEEHLEKVSLPDEYGWVDFYLLPFVKPSVVKAIVGVQEDGASFSYHESVKRLLARENLDPARRNVLVSHQFYVPAGKTAEEVERMESEIRTVGNIDQVSAEVLEGFDYAALGHIHRPMVLGNERFRYSGTPLACSVSESGQQKGIVMVELPAKGEPPVITVLPLKPLREVRVLCGDLEEILPQGCGDYVTVILTDPPEANLTDVRERLGLAFPRLLEIRRDYRRLASVNPEIVRKTMQDPYALCCAFIPNLDEEEKAILRDVIESVSQSS